MTMDRTTRAPHLVQFTILTALSQLDNGSGYQGSKALPYYRTFVLLQPRTYLTQLLVFSSSHTHILTRHPLAFEILSDEGTHPDPAIRAELVLLLARAAGWRGMAQGQALDLSAERRSFRPAEIAAMQALKTGALFRFACEAGVALGRAALSERAALVAYASAFGQAFQLADDLLDAEGDAGSLGKAVAKDSRRGKATLIARLGPDEARKRLDELVAEAEQALAPFGARAEVLKELARFIATRKA